MARATIRRTLELLEKQSAVTRKQGVGTYLQPKQAALSSLRGRRIGVIPPWWAEAPTSWYYASIFDGVSRWAEENDCAFHILHAPGRPLHAHQWLERIRRLDLAGIVWVQPQEAQHKLLFTTAHLFPTIVLGRSITGKGLHHVLPDYRRAAELIDTHLVEMGHTTYGVIGKNVFDPFTTVWLDCFRAAHQRRGVEFQARYHHMDFGCFGLESLPDLIMDYFLKDRPELSALVFPSSGYLESLKLNARFHERIRKGLSVVTTNYGLNDIQTMFPGFNMTHITCDWSGMARRTLSTLALLAEGYEVPENTYEDVSLIQGDTVHGNVSALQAG